MTSSILYCRRCDLGFCKEHYESHMHGDQPDDFGEWPPGAIPFCCVCTGIYAPPPLSKEERL